MMDRSYKRNTFRGSNVQHSESNSAILYNWNLLRESILLVLTTGKKVTT